MGSLPFRRLAALAAPALDGRLLRDVSVAFKHHIPDHGTVAVSTDIVPAGTGVGNLR